MAKYVIYGAGGVGGTIGMALHRQGHDVVLLARGEHLAKLQQEGLVLHTPEQTFRERITAVAAPVDIPFDKEYICFFCMKSQDTRKALLALRKASGTKILLVMCQNGVANERMAARRFSSVYGMFVYMPAVFLTPGVVSSYASPLLGILDVGCYPKGSDKRVQSICADLKMAGFSTKVDPAIMRLKYGKLLLNINNAIQALCGTLQNAESLIEKLEREALQCFQAAGIDYATQEEILTRQGNIIEEKPISGSLRTGGSSWQSLQRKTGTIEVDYLNGEIVCIGTEWGIPTPYNRAVQELAIKSAQLQQLPGNVSPKEIISYAKTFQ